MSEQVIWSNNGSADYARGLSDEEKFNHLVDRGYDPEMLGNANLDDVINDDDYMWQDDTEQFEEEIVPMLNDQTRSGVVILVNENGDGKAAFVDDLKGGDIDPDVNNVEIVYDGDGLVWKGDGKEYMLFAIPEDEDSFKEFVKLCLVNSGYYVDDEDNPSTEDEIADEIIDTFDMEDEVQLLNSYCDWSKVGSVCPRMQPYGVELNANESLNEASTEDPDTLAAELEEIKPLVDDYGYEYFTAMPLTNFDNDPTSVEYQYPRFFGVIKAFFKEMGLVENPDDNDELDDQWNTVDQHDFNTMIKVADKLVENPGEEISTEEVFGDEDYESPLNDDEILADREAGKEPDVDDNYRKLAKAITGESLKESLQLNEVKTKDPDRLAADLEKVKKLGYDKLKDMPLTINSGDRQSIEAKFPEFFNVIWSFFREMELMDDPTNKDELDDQWDNGGFYPEDLDTMIEAAEWCIKQPHKGHIISNMYKDHYKSPFKSDKEILADREKGIQDDPYDTLLKALKDESLDEAKHEYEKVVVGEFTDEDQDRLYAPDLEEEPYDFFQGEVVLDDPSFQKKAIANAVDGKVKLGVYEQDGEYLVDILPADFDEAVLGSLDTPEQKDAAKRAFAKQARKEADAKNHAEYKKHPSRFDIKADKEKLNEWEDNGYRQHIWIVIDDEDERDAVVDACGEPEGEGDYDDGKYVLDYYFDDLDSAQEFAFNIPDGFEWNEEEMDESLNEEVYSREEDVAIDADTPEDVIAELNVPEGITAEVIEMEGPGAGWPVVRFSGDKAVVDAYLAEIGYENL